EADDAIATVIFQHGFAAYAALYLPFLGLLRTEGFNVIALDRPGHGLSEGRRGDCTVRELADLTALLIADVARRCWKRPIVLMGSSAGGILTSCTLPYLETSVDAAVCHNLYDARHLRVPGRRILSRMVGALPPVPFR